jgi:hypothetical protein
MVFTIHEEEGAGYEALTIRDGLTILGMPFLRGREYFPTGGQSPQTPAFRAKCETLEGRR